MILLALSDFKNEYSIPDATGTYSAAKAQSYIDRYEKRYLNRLLGVTLAAKVIAYLAANRTPADADLNKIIDAFSFQDTGREILESAGIKEVLTGCVFYEYIHNSLIVTQAGVAAPKVETADVSTPAKTMRFAENKFNGILDSVDAIQNYCLLNPSKYPDYDGRRITVKFAGIL